MTIYLTPNITDEKIAAMEIFDAFRLGEELLDSRYPRDAARVLRKVVDAEPGNAAGWELLGRSHFAAAQLCPAEDAFRRLVELEPTSAWAQTALGLALDRQSRHREGAVHHRLAAAMGASARDASRVELVDRPKG
ncbi:tetratricopeptide repeat protein [Aeromicrobium wangtongii]|uniref:Tetratricopeptide repeat protein n=1 Tax=Aeromicrobium wangtongii TaxID=2969247 RepID=A0ABY5M5M4_9ACTN|nr:tetratricopeptide repeat protein [Aeromicrobium wangtongii]MCD9198269.1 tetratricopeptide repeat protein [Aeromicrobium wangtongii]MCL3819020.1 tetratricopeptide repeat protein [Aeromicrobium wangtongii]UUP12303.1 tetratricopeptide repeat protein [Aeromicrobium wangtongii]